MHRERGREWVLNVLSVLRILSVLKDLRVLMGRQIAALLFQPEVTVLLEGLQERAQIVHPRSLLKRPGPLTISKLLLLGVLL